MASAVLAHGLWALQGRLWWACPAALLAPCGHLGQSPEHGARLPVELSPPRQVLRAQEVAAKMGGRAGVRGLPGGLAFHPPGSACTRVCRCWGQDQLPCLRPARCACRRGQPQATHPGRAGRGWWRRAPGLRCGDFSTRLLASWRARTQPGNLVEPGAMMLEGWCSPATRSAGGAWTLVMGSGRSHSIRLGLQHLS